MSDFVPPPLFSAGNQQRQASSSSSSSSSSGGVKKDATGSDAKHGDGTTKITSHNQYHTSGLSESDLLPNPLHLFQKWFDQASSSDSGIKEPEAMLLCTVDATQTPPRPSSRVVLLKSIHPTEGLTFYTNYTSRKAREMDSNPHVSTTFYWNPTSQSIRFVGKVKKVSKQESQEYFDSRPMGSRIGAHASPQSTSIPSREFLEARLKDFETKFGKGTGAGTAADSSSSSSSSSDEGKKVPVPDYWGGYRIEPYEVEFWVGRPSRLHDRFRYTRNSESGKLAGEDQWKVERLAP